MAISKRQARPLLDGGIVAATRDAEYFGNKLMLPKRTRLSGVKCSETVGPATLMLKVLVFVGFR